MCLSKVKVSKSWQASQPRPLTNPPPSPLTLRCHKALDMLTSHNVESGDEGIYVIVATFCRVR